VKLSAKQAKQYVQAVNEETHALTRLWNARLILELARIQEAKQYLKAIPRDEKMVIFVERVDSAHLYAEALSTARGGKFVVITGKETDLQRDQAVTAVQEDDSVRGVVGTYGSTAEGIDLWRANHVFFGSQPWTPATQAQSEDRCNRLGQTRKVNVVIPLYEGTLDIDVRELIDSKFEIASDILDPGESERKSIQAVANGIKRRRPEVNGEAAA
jgi:SNF2 family DNA or RNA helicase